MYQDIGFSDFEEKVLDELLHESPRSCAIVGAAILDDLLGRILGIYLTSDEESYDALLNPDKNAPLSSFYARTCAGYAIGLLNQQQRDALNIIRRVRNCFAHNLQISFNDTEIVDLVNKFPKEIPIITIQNPTPRDTFHSMVTLHWGGLKEKMFILEKGNMRANFNYLKRLFIK